MLIAHASKAQVLVVTVLLVIYALSAQTRIYITAEDSSEYERYVHSHSDPNGNWTFMEKPMFPVFFNHSQIPIGQNWSVVCSLLANHSYHIYCYGEWISNGSEPKTDYDIYVYNALGEMEGYHTESAGLPEHLGTTVEQPFFVPKHDGNYTFVLANDPRESKAAQQVTFMIIEAIACNRWRQHYVEGKDSFDTPVFNTSWSYEFITESQQIQVYIKVPETLDMYEARLYLMSNPNSKNETALNGIPLAWEPGLFGNRTKGKDIVGGYNLESKEYRGVACESCECHGEDMSLNYTSPYAGKTLYYLVLIGEIGSGEIDFLVKTEFDSSFLEPLTMPRKVVPQSEATVAYTSNFTDLEDAKLCYTTDGWKTSETTNMEIVDNRTCRAVIPGQAAGSCISYTVDARDILENAMTINGTYSVKHASALNLSSHQKEAKIGENMTVEGTISPPLSGLPITVCFVSTNQTKRVVCYSLEDGGYSASLQPEIVGTWFIYAVFNETDSVSESVSSSLSIEVAENVFSKYSLYIFGSIGAVAAVGIVIYVKKVRS